jgi:hypothetical protein
MVPGMFMYSRMNSSCLRNCPSIRRSSKMWENHWIGFREKLWETMGFPMNYSGASCKFSQSNDNSIQFQRSDQNMTQNPGTLLFTPKSLVVYGVLFRWWHFHSFDPSKRQSVVSQRTDDSGSTAGWWMCSLDPHNSEWCIATQEGSNSFSRMCFWAFYP